MAKKTKYYVVWVGHTPGVYGSWAECQAQVKGYPDARYKAFSSKEDAEDAFAAGFEYKQTAKKTKPRKTVSPDLPVEWKSISVDAACSGNPGVMEYRGVDTATGDEIFRQGPFTRGTNNIGEFLAIVHALALLKQRQDDQTPVYTDSRTAMAWVRKRKANTKINWGTRNNELRNLVVRAENWLKKETYTTRILKWETEAWGEIPADFGRK